jgi:hypothetical protein
MIGRSVSAPNWNSFGIPVSMLTALITALRCRRAWPDDAGGHWA